MGAVTLIDMHQVPFNPKKFIRIDRKSEWGNPFELSDRKDEAERLDVIWKYTLYLLRNQKLLKKVRTLKGKTLACWCFPQYKCHGQILIYMSVHLDIVQECLKPSCDREKIAEDIFKELGWVRVKRYEQAKLF